MEESREDSILMASICERAERYDEMVAATKQVAKLNVDLSIEERNLLSVAYKNIIGTRRASWRIITSVEQKERSKENEVNLRRIRDFKTKVEREIEAICMEILDILEIHIIPSSQSVEAKIFYYKMKGDYWRYVAEFKTGEAGKEASNNSSQAYKYAAEDLSQDLSWTHPVRLGLALSFAVFQYEIYNEREKAIQLAKHAFDSAISELDTLTEDRYKEVTLIMQLLRDNLELWIQEKNDICT